MDENELVERTLTCRTGGCVNDGATVTMPALDLAYCGGCGQQITDIK